MGRNAPISLGMVRPIKTLLFSILTLCVVGIFLYFNAANLLAKIISRKMGLPVSIESIDFAKNRLTIGKLSVKNPPKARLPIAFEVEKIEVISPYSHYVKNPIKIEKIDLKNLYINVQIYNKEKTEGNWQTIMSRVDQDNKSPLSFEREVTIKELLLTEIKVDLILPDGERHHLSPIDKIEFKNLTTEKGIPIHEISEIIVKKVIKFVFLSQVFKAITEIPVDLFKGIFRLLGEPQEKKEEPELNPP